MKLATTCQENIADHCARERRLDLEGPFPGTGSTLLWGALIGNEVQVVEEVTEFWVHPPVGLNGTAFDL